MINPETIIKRAETFLNTGDNRQIICSFMEKYSKCEVLCRSVLKDYLVGTNDYTSDEDMIMDLTTIRCALTDTGYIFEDNKILTRIWGKADKKGFSSCRFLRNKIAHKLMTRALQETVERKDNLNADMDKFIAVISSN